MPPWGHQSRVCAASWHRVSAAGGLHGACGAVVGQGGLAPQPGKRVGAVVLAAVSPGEAPSPELRLSFLPLEGKCVARGIGDLLPPL